MTKNDVFNAIIQNMDDITIKVYPYSAVVIGETLIQGHEADTFVNDAKALYESHGTITMNDAYKIIASSWG